MRNTVAVVLVMGLALGASGCGIVELPEGVDRPSLPTAFPTRDSGDSPEQEAPPEEPAPDEPAPDEPAPDEPDEPAPPVDEEEGPADPDEGSTPWWLIGVAVLALAVVVIIIVQRGSGSRRWDQGLASVRRDLRWLDEALVADVLAKSTSDNARAAWQAAKPRLLAMDEELFGLQTAQLDEERTARAAADLSALRTLVAALDAETSTQGPADAEELRRRRAAVEEARAEMRGRYASDSS